MTKYRTEWLASDGISTMSIEIICRDYSTIDPDLAIINTIEVTPGYLALGRGLVREFNGDFPLGIMSAPSLEILITCDMQTSGLQARIVDRERPACCILKKNDVILFAGAVRPGANASLDISKSILKVEFICVSKLALERITWENVKAWIEANIPEVMVYYIWDDYIEIETPNGPKVRGSLWQDSNSGTNEERLIRYRAVKFSSLFQAISACAVNAHNYIMVNQVDSMNWQDFSQFLYSRLENVPTSNRYYIALDIIFDCYDTEKNCGLKGLYGGEKSIWDFMNDFFQNIGCIAWINYDLTITPYTMDDYQVMTETTFLNTDKIMEIKEVNINDKIARKAIASAEYGERKKYELSRVEYYGLEYRQFDSRNDAELTATMIFSSKKSIYENTITIGTSTYSTTKYRYPYTLFYLTTSVNVLNNSTPRVPVLKRDDTVKPFGAVNDMMLKDIWENYLVEKLIGVYGSTNTDTNSVTGIKLKLDGADMYLNPQLSIYLNIEERYPNNFVIPRGNQEYKIKSVEYNLEQDYCEVELC